jgi:Lysyl oxidase
VIRVRPKSFIALSGVVVAAAAAVMGLGPAAAHPSAVVAADVLPDLAMAPLANLQIQKTSDGHRLLRYSATIVNLGAGPLELHGQRPDTSTTDMSVTQRIYDSAGGQRDVTTTATMYWAGDGHNHWHTRDLESGDLVRLDNGVKQGALAKHGFCFSDNVAYRLSTPGAPQTPAYLSCGTDPNLLSVTMGLSVGWGDLYPWNIAFQYIDITGLTAGRYRLIATADQQNFFQESNDTNNSAWVDLQLKDRGNALKILGSG